MKLFLLILFTFIFSCQVFTQENNKTKLDSNNSKVKVESEPDPDEFIALDKEVQIDQRKFASNFSYPEEAKKAGIQGTVVMQVLVGADGKPQKAKILSSDNKMLNESAIRTVTEFDGYVPATQNKKPIASWITIPIVFKLN